MRIKNLLNSPVTVHATPKSITLGPGKSADIDGFQSGYEPWYRQSAFFEIDDDQKQTEDDIEALRAEYTELTGEKPHHLWKEARLRSEIESKKAD